MMLILAENDRDKMDGEICSYWVEPEDGDRSETGTSEVESFRKFLEDLYVYAQDVEQLI